MADSSIVSSSGRQKVLVVGDDNFTFSSCLLDNEEQWLSKLGGKNDWQIEVACCVAMNKVPTEYVGDMKKLQSRGITIHFGVNPALLRQYFPSIENGDNRPGPLYDVILFILPGLQFEGCPRYIEKNSDLFKLRLHLYWFALAKSSGVITKKDGRVLYLWIEQESVAKNNSLLASLPFPLIDIHKLGPFCKIKRSEHEDFRLNLSWGDYKTRWKPLIHNTELLHFPSYLEDLKVYCFRNTPYEQLAGSQGEKLSPSTAGDSTKPPPDDVNLLRIPQSICQWDRNILPHVNELFHFNLRTNQPGEMIQISKLSVKYDPRITGWRNSGHVPRDAVRQSVPPPGGVAAAAPSGAGVSTTQNTSLDLLSAPLPYLNSWARYTPPAAEPAAAAYQHLPPPGGPAAYSSQPQQYEQPPGEQPPPAAYDSAGSWSAFSAGYWPSDQPQAQPPDYYVTPQFSAPPATQQETQQPYDYGAVSYEDYGDQPRSRPAWSSNPPPVDSKLQWNKWAPNESKPATWGGAPDQKPAYEGLSAYDRTYYEAKGAPQYETKNPYEKPYDNVPEGYDTQAPPYDQAPNTYDSKGGGGGGPYESKPPAGQYDNKGWAYEKQHGGTGYEKANPYDKGPYDKGPYDKGPYDKGPYDKGPYDKGPYDKGPYSKGPYDKGPHGGDKGYGGYEKPVGVSFESSEYVPSRRPRPGLRRDPAIEEGQRNNRSSSRSKHGSQRRISQ